MSEGTSIPVYTPERLSLWDRVFNRTRREVHGRGKETWTKRPRDPYGYYIGKPYEYTRTWVEYRVIDRVTGSVTIEREYLT